MGNGNFVLLAAGVQIACDLIGSNGGVFLQLNFEDIILGNGLFLGLSFALLVVGVLVLVVDQFLHFALNIRFIDGNAIRLDALGIINEKYYILPVVHEIPIDLICQ